MDKDSLKLFLDQGLSLEEIGRRIGRHPSTVGYWVKKHGLTPAGRAKHAARGAIPPEGLASLIEEDATCAFMADAYGVSVATIRYWLKRYGLETARAERMRKARSERSRGRAITQLTCRHHGLTDFWLEGRGVYRCRQCRIDAVVRRRASVRETLIAEAGGCCVLCGYERYHRALHFHHVDPRSKRFTIRDGTLRGLDVLRAEARKCVLLCANCHAEVESGVTALPARVSGVKVCADRTTYPA
ncbi:MAG TPA: helix-turn-helix domain-containing protein [Thermoleophilaceae bacterium]